MSDTSTHLGLPYLLAAQAQKHVTHNEALRLLDAMVQLSVLDRTRTTPPASPADGDRHLVASGATGLWAGWDLNVAFWVDGVWLRLVPRPGWLVWIAAEQVFVVWNGSAWDPEAARTGSDRPPRGECRSPAPGAAYPPGKEGHMFHHHARLALGTALLLAASVASAEDLKLADFQPATHPYVEKVYTSFAEDISAATDGEVAVTLFMGGELGPGPADQYNRAVDGVADIAFGLPGYTATTFPKTLLTELPGVIDAQSGTTAILANLDQLADEYRRTPLIGLWSNAPNLLFMTGAPVRTPADLAGKNIRVPSRNAGLVIEAWGGTPVSMPAPEIYNALQTGVIDGAFIDATTLNTFRLSEVVNSITEGMDSTISSFFLIMNRDSFASLSEAQQAAVLDAGKAASERAHAVQLDGAAAALEAFAAMPGKTLIQLTPEEAAPFNQASAGVVEKLIADADAEGLDASAYVAALAGN